MNDSMTIPDFYHWMDHTLAAQNQHAEIARLTGIGNGRMLELFSGKGQYLKYFQDKGWECLGLANDEAQADYSMLEQGVPTLCGDPKEVNLPRNSYDVVRIRGALSTYEDTEALLHIALEATAYTGFFIAETWNGSGFPVCHNPSAVKNVFTKDTLAKTVRDAGFDVGGIYAPPLGDSVWFPTAQQLPDGAPPLPGLHRRLLGSVCGLVDRGSLLVIFAQRPPKHQEQ